MRTTFLLFTCLLCLFCASCGGGSAGTGTRTIEGTIRDVQGRPLSDVVVTSLGEGESATSNQEGQFILTTSATTQDLELQLQTANLNTTITVSQTGEPSSTIELEIFVDPATNSAKVSDIQLRTQIVGTCDSYFENRRVIRQSTVAPQGVVCTAKISLYINGSTFGNIPFVIQYRACPKNSAWITTAAGLTMSGTHSGVGQLDFQFFNDAEHCVYQVLAPYKYGDAAEVSYEIDTFTKQAFDSSTSN